MTSSPRSALCAVAPAVIVAVGLAATVRGAPMVWDIDPAASFIRLTIPDQPVVVPGLGTVTVRLRDAGSTTQWTDAGGRRAFLDGQIATDYVNFASISFQGGASGIFALEQANLRPDPAQWNTATAQYGGTGTAPAAFGARIRGTYTVVLPITFDAGFMALRQVWFDLSSGVIPLGPGGEFAGSQTQFGIAAALADVDGLELPLGLGQPIPDLLHEPVPAGMNANTSGGIIENLGGPSRRLTLDVNVPILLELDAAVVTGSAAGKIVAYGTVPVPPVPYDFEGDGDVDRDDDAVFRSCMTAPAIPGTPTGCVPEWFVICDADGDLDVDQADYGTFQRCYSGRNIAAPTTCIQQQAGP